MRYLILTGILLSFMSCIQSSKQEPANEKVEKTQTIDTAGFTAKELNDNVPVIAETAGPDKHFFMLIEYIENLGYTHDTNRIKKVNLYKELNAMNITIFSGKPFYKIQSDSHPVLKLKNSKLKPGAKIDFELFESSGAIWAYFYRINKKEAWNEDGVIEQWEFKNEVDAKKAYTNLKLIYPFPYFNTFPYYINYKDKLFVFHTRAAAFSYKQKVIFEYFKENCLPDSDE